MVLSVDPYTHGFIHGPMYPWTYIYIHGFIHGPIYQWLYPLTYISSALSLHLYIHGFIHGPTFVPNNYVSPTSEDVKPHITMDLHILALSGASLAWLVREHAQ